MTKHIAIVGSCNFPNPELVQEYVNALSSAVIIVSGGAKGVDTWAEEAAKSCGLQTQIFHAEWQRFGRRAGPIRNEQIVAHSEHVVAFWDGESRGTLNTLLHAVYAGLPVETYGLNGESLELPAVLRKAMDNGAYSSWAKGKASAGKTVPTTVEELLGSYLPSREAQR